jgi:dienelactone hydrolase
MIPTTRRAGAVAGLVVSSLIAPGIGAAQSTPAAQAPPAYSTVFYKSGALRIEAYLYLPSRPGPSPLVIYNHGSRAGNERVERTFAFVGRLLTDEGYAVLVPERRGYGKSDGQPFSEEIGTDKGPKFIARQQAEADDVIAALDYAKTVPSIDTAHAAVMGWSFGGIVSVFAAAKTNRFLAVVDQAGGSLSWKSSPELQKALPAAALAITAPMMCLVAENDATTEAVAATCNATKSLGRPAALIVYPPFIPAQNANGLAPGHLVFTAEGVGIWQKDVLAFLAKHLGREGTPGGKSATRVFLKE